MPTTCEIDAFYLGSVGPLTALYAGDTLVWPCYDCSVEDPVFLWPVYSDALMYVPRVCTSGIPGIDDRISDAVSETNMEIGPAFNGVWSYASVGETFGFIEPLAGQEGGIIVEALLVALTDIVGIESSAVSFYITLDEDVASSDEGVIVRVEEMEIELVESVTGTRILARANRQSPDSPLELEALVDLDLGTEIHIIVNYEKLSGDDRLVIYYNTAKVGEVTG